MASIIKADNIQKVSDGTNIIKKCGSTITLGSCGATISLACWCNADRIWSNIFCFFILHNC
jgi:hypothetical protein